MQIKVINETGKLPTNTVVNQFVTETATQAEPKILTEKALLIAVLHINMKKRASRQTGSCLTHTEASAIVVCSVCVSLCSLIGAVARSLTFVVHVRWHLHITQTDVHRQIIKVVVGG